MLDFHFSMRIYFSFIHFVSAGIKTMFVILTSADLSQQVQAAMENMLKMIKWVDNWCYLWDKFVLLATDVNMQYLMEIKG